ncbi:hypothetical protein L596_020123 [Steinernema carpocapsae]|uniref:C-type lectin domain-containing protein n=1 Tax=Steinernema carpocapsae TaxID=34508 RepID=A0A4U5MSL4_STECR|nr:hypothetical protein L596_020123 [Steinernema carpocapsae]
MCGLLWVPDATVSQISSRSTTVALGLILASQNRTCPPNWIYQYQSDAWRRQTFCKHFDGGDLVSKSFLLTWIGLQGNSSHWTSGDEVEFKKWVSPKDAKRDAHYCLRTQEPEDGCKAVRGSYTQPLVCKQRADSCPGATQWKSRGVISSSNFPSY